MHIFKINTYLNKKRIKRVTSIVNITLKSAVNSEPKKVFNGFDSKLFTYLLPPGAELIQFGGAVKGDVVHLKLPLAGEWISLITENGQTEDGYYFVDEGEKLPFPLKEWRHKHIVEAHNGGTRIVDDMTFSTGNYILDLMLFPILYVSFFPRTWQYKKYFK